MIENNAVGDETQFMYIGIHGFDTFQVDAKGVLRDGSMQWIKDACRKEADKDYGRLTCFCRYILDALRRLRGLNGKNVANDVPYICRTLSILAPDRPHVRSALCLLVARGLLILTNEPLHFEEVLERKKERGSISPTATADAGSRKSKAKGRGILTLLKPGCSLCINPARRLDIPGCNADGDLCSCCVYKIDGKEVAREEYEQRLHNHEYEPQD